MNMEIFRLVEQAAFANPFSDTRVEIDRLIARAPAEATWEEMQAPLFSTLEQSLRELETAGRLAVGRNADPDTQAIGVSVLFYVFYQFQVRFDTLIEEQIAAGDDPCEAPFALDCMNQLIDYGFSQANACRYVAIFYQIRRAYYFISRGLVGNSPCMKQLRARLWDNIFTHDIAWYEQSLWNRMEDFSTLLLGETGTGKGAAAAAIGRSGFIAFNPKTNKFSESFTRAFVSINLSQYPESLIESELFGHRKGAFTGAMEHHDGILAQCSPHGSIFLDEIGDVAVPIQIKLLQVLQERTYSPVGSHEKLRFQGRVIAATNRSLDTLRREGTFRDDFYYRLCSDIITVPPLRQRIREVPLELDALCEHITQRICGDGLHVPLAELLRAQCGKHYAWPGNVRELEQAIRRVILTGTYEGDRSAETPPGPAVQEAAEAGTLSARDLVAEYCRKLYDTYGNYGEVARRTGLDWRTVKKNVAFREAPPPKP